jgi:hypothetical protein
MAFRPPKSITNPTPASNASKIDSSAFLAISPRFQARKASAGKIATHAPLVAFKTRQIRRKTLKNMADILYIFSFVVKIANEIQRGKTVTSHAPKPFGNLKEAVILLWELHIG